jgi:hypothetical protein
MGPWPCGVASSDQDRENGSEDPRVGVRHTFDTKESCKYIAQMHNLKLKSIGVRQVVTRLAYLMWIVHLEDRLYYF